MQKRKVALISREELSAWKSCQSITSSLEKVYQKVFVNDEIHLIKTSQNLNRYSGYKLASELRTKNIDTIVWLDHKPNPGILLEALLNIYQDTSFDKKPKMLIHLFGDFVLECLEWKAAQVALSNWPLHFFTASRKHKELVESFFISDNKNISVLPFPVDKASFYFDQSEEMRNSFRLASGVGVEDRIILYTGRISYQKNIELLVKIFTTIQLLFQNKVQLWIAGEWDDILVPYEGKIGLLGSFYAQFLETSEKYLNNQIKFLGKLNSEQLLQAYNAADLFVSFSTYNDEDYGMSPAEAMSCGLPCLLSNWGGYSSFQEYSSGVDLVPVIVGNDRPIINIELARKKIIKAITDLPMTSNKRIQVATEAQSAFSIEAIATFITSNLNGLSFGTVSEFSKDFLKLCVLTEMNPGSPFKKGKTLELSDFYKVVYARYGA